MLCLTVVGTSQPFGAGVTTSTADWYYIAGQRT